MKHLVFYIVLFIFGFCSAIAGELTVASFNIRNQNERDSLNGNAWEQRCPVICELVRFNNFQVFGAQEVLHNQLQDMLTGLPGYDFIGVGRDDGKTQGEYAPVFYQKEKLEVLESGNFWLSEITDRPNKGWDAALPRICTWVKFKERNTGFEFYFFNLHMDHLGEQARKNSAKLILNTINERCKDKPVIVTGDFNFDQNSPDFKLLDKSDVLDDAYRISEIKFVPNGTFNGFDPNSKTESRIDHVFVSNNFKVKRFGILSDTYWSPLTQEEKKNRAGNNTVDHEFKARTPSDHYPVKVMLSY